MHFSFSRINQNKETWPSWGRNGLLLFEIWCTKSDKKHSFKTPN